MYSLDAAGGANLFGTGPQGRWQGKRPDLQGPGAGVNTTGFGQPKCPSADTTSKHGPAVPASSAKGLLCCPGAVEDVCMGGGGVLLGYHIHPHQTAGAWAGDGGESPRQIYLSLELNFLMSQKMFASAGFGQM